MSDSQLRCFIAVPLPGRIKKGLAVIQSALKGRPIKAGWPSPSGFHLTLTFLGKVPLHKISAVESAMAVAAAETQCFNLTFGALGAFPRPDKARVLWIGLDEGADELKRLRQRIVSRLKKDGLPVENQKFSPHITLARIKQPVTGRSIQTLMNLVPYPSVNMFPVGCIHLYKSQLARSGAVHTSLCAAKLSGFFG